MAVETVHKVTLSTGKIVLMRDMKIKHQSMAAKAIGNRFAEQPYAAQVALQNELLKILLCKIDDKEFKSHENLDDVLSVAEYNQCLKAMNQVGGGTADDPLIEVSSSGDKLPG